MIFFERNIPLKGKGPQHMHIQAIPVPVNRSAQIRTTFEKEAEAVGFQLKEVDKNTPLKEVAFNFFSLFSLSVCVCVCFT
jgi:hypothetical protein